MVILFISFLLLMLLAVGTGHVLLVWALNWGGEKPFLMRLGAAFFFGISFFVVLVRSFTTLTNHADWATWMTMLAAALVCAISLSSLKALVRELVSTKSLWLVLLAVFLTALILFIYWADRSSTHPNNPFDSFGSLHSVRYAWLANVIEVCNRIPVLGQNTGQSLLSYVGGTISTRAPFAFLYLWLITSIVFLTVFVYGALSLYESGKVRILVATLLFMLGNTAASLTHVLVIDSGSPFLLNGYSDTLLGVFSVLMALFVHQELSTDKSKKIKLFLIISLLFIANFFSAPQNLVLLAVLLPLMLIKVHCAGRNYRAFIFWLLILIVTTLIAIPQGGMLTPKAMQATVDYQGLMDTVGRSTGITIVPGYPFSYGSGGAWFDGQSASLREATTYMVSPIENAMLLLWLVEQTTTNSLRVLFFPLLGLIGLFLLSRCDSVYLRNTAINRTPSLRSLFYVGTILSFTGFSIAYSITLNGYKWELSRFAIPGIVLGMFGISLWIMNLMEKKRSVFAGAIIIFMLCGPIINLAHTSLANFKAYYQLNNVGGYIRIISGQGPSIDPLTCSRFP